MSSRPDWEAGAGDIGAESDSVAIQPAPAELPPLPLGDLTVAETVDVAADLLLRHRKIFLQLIALLFIPPHAIFMTAIFLLSPESTLWGAFAHLAQLAQAPEEALAAGGKGDVGLLLAIQMIYGFLTIFVITPLTTGALTRAAAVLYLGHPLSVGDAARWAARKFLPLTFTMILYWIAVFGILTLALLIPLIPATVLLTARAGSTLTLIGFALGLIGLVVAMIIYVVATVRFSVWNAVIACENISLFAALRRSAALTRTRVSRGIWLAVVVWLINVFLTLASSFLPVLEIMGLLNACVTGLTVTLSVVVTKIYYFNCLCRHENFDLTRLMTAPEK
jgi:hypothetical protein